MVPAPGRGSLKRARCPSSSDDDRESAAKFLLLLPTTMFAIKFIFSPFHSISKRIVEQLECVKDLATFELVSQACFESVGKYGWPAKKHLDLRAIVRARRWGRSARLRRLVFSVLGVAELSEERLMALLHHYFARASTLDSLSITFRPPTIRKCQLDLFHTALGRIVRWVAANLQSFDLRVTSIRLDGLGHDDRLAMPGILLPYLGVKSSTRRIFLHPILARDSADRPLTTVPDEEVGVFHWSNLDNIEMWQCFPEEHESKMDTFLLVCKFLLPTLVFSGSESIEVTLGWLDYGLAANLVLTLLQAPEYLSSIDLGDTASPRIRQLLSQDILHKPQSIKLKICATEQGHVFGSLVEFLSVFSATYLLEGAQMVATEDASKVSFKYGSVSLEVSEIQSP